MALEAAIETEDLTQHLRDIVYLDAVLLKKTHLQKLAIDERLQVEEGVCQSIRKYIESDSSTGEPDQPEAFRTNSQQFINIVNAGITEREKLQQRSVNLRTLEYEGTQGTNGYNEDRILTSVASAANVATFITRNKRLAKCGQGVLSLTDEEKQRLKILMEEDGKSEKKESESISFHRIPRLDAIDEQLKKFKTENNGSSEDENHSKRPEQPWKRTLRGRIARLKVLNKKLAEVVQDYETAVYSSESSSIQDFLLHSPTKDSPNEASANDDCQ